MDLHKENHDGCISKEDLKTQNKFLNKINKLVEKMCDEFTEKNLFFNVDAFFTSIFISHLKSSINFIRSSISTEKHDEIILRFINNHIEIIREETTNYCLEFIKCDSEFKH